MFKDLMQEEIQEKVELLEEARELIEEAVHKIQVAVIGTNEKERTRSYLISTLEMCCFKHTQWLGTQPCNIEELIEALQEEDTE